jgi:hypothetical protein
MNVNSDKPRVMPLNQALNYLQHNNAILHYDNRVKVDLWTPNSPSKVPITLRRAVVKYSNELETLMHQGDVRLCPNANLHRKHYKYTGNGAWACEMCQVLDPEVSRS